VVIVDNNSHDNSIQELSRWCSKNVSFSSCTYNDDVFIIENKHVRKSSNPRVYLIKSNVIRGFAANNNIAIKFGIKQDDADLFWLLNNDTVIKPNTLTELVSVIESDSSIGVTGSKLIFHHDPERVQSLGNDNIGWKGIGYGRYDGISVNDPLPDAIEMKSIVGASLLVKKNVVDEVGLMDENYFMIHEESDWCVRIAGAGYKLLACPKSEVLHKEGKSTERKRTEKRFLGIRSSRTTIHDFIMWGYYSIRNEIYFVHKNFKNRYMHFIFFSLAKKYIIKSLSIFLFNDDYKLHRLCLINKAILDGLKGRMGITINIRDWKNKFS
jgi:hypothetical protein